MKYLLPLLGIVFLVLKLTGVINWAWPMVLLPFIIWFVMLVLVLFVLGFILKKQAMLMRLLSGRSD